MHQSKLIDLLKKFSTRDLRLLHEITASPYFNKNTDLHAFMEHIKKYAPRFVNKKLKKETVWKSLFGSKKYDEKYLGYLMSDLQRLAESYIAHESFAGKEILNKVEVLDHYNQVNLDKHFKKIMRDVRKQQERSSYRDAPFYFRQYKIEEEQNRFFDKQKKREADITLQKAIDNLDIYYLITKLKYSCEIINRKNVITADYELRLLDEILHYLKENPHDHIPALVIYYQTLRMLLEQENESHFKKLKNLLIKHSHKFPVEEARDMYTYAQNYCINKINKGSMEFMKELFSLYNTVLEKEIIFENGQLSHWSYKNIVGLALALDEDKWTENFILQYDQYLSDEYRESVVAFNMANLHFYRKEFGEALRLLQQVELSNVFYHLNTKRMILKIYYELGEEEALLSHLSAFKIYLKRNRLITEYVNKSYTNLITFTKKALRFKEEQQLKKLRKEIEDTRHVADIKWLIQKVEEISV